MAYMSYCRFEGTLEEMKICLCDVDEHINEEAEYEVSDREIGCFKDMVSTFWTWMIENELVDENGELVEDELENICETMRHGYDPEDY